MTTNHPANGPVSLDRLHQISEILSKAAAQSDGGNLGYAMADAVKVIDGAIAAANAKAIVPDELLSAMEEVLRISGRDHEAWHKARNGIASCRAAMLQAGNSTVTPDGYALVPIVPTEGMVINGFESEPDEFFSKSEEWDAYQEMSGCEQAAHRAKLCWTAMIKAAPQQEVK